jgi:hypothetical protein
MTLNSQPKTGLRRHCGRRSSAFYRGPGDAVTNLIIAYNRAVIWKRRMRCLVLLLITVPISFTAQAEKPQRTVRYNIITSEHDPPVQIRLPESTQYVGADRWVLFGIADCELHAFVEADDQRNVRRFYWVQFEGYLPTKPELHHRYDSPRHANIGGLDFYVDTAMSVSDEKTTPGSDSEHIRALIDGHGYKRPAQTMYVRFVYLLDEEKRKELMIIYSEDLAPTGFAVADLEKGGKAYQQWAGIEKGLVERAKEKIRITVNRNSNQGDVTR